MGHMHNPPHPGKSIREDVLPALGITVTGAAGQLGVARVTLSRLINGQAGISTALFCFVRELCSGRPSSRHSLGSQAARLGLADNIRAIPRITAKTRDGLNFLSAGNAVARMMKSAGCRSHTFDAKETPDGLFQSCDVADDAQARDCAGNVLKQDGRIDLLFVAAGVHLFADSEEPSIEELERVLSINLKGPF